MYFFSFIYNMLKCQKEEKGFCKTQKYELQLLPVACCFHKNELELFREAWPRRPPASPDASGLPPFPSTLPQPSTPPISHFFFFFFLPPFFFFSFFSFFLLSPFSFFFFSLLFLVYTFFFLAFFYLLFSFLFPFYFFYHITLHVFYVHQPKGCKTERSSVSRSRSHDVQWTSVLRRPKRREDSLPLAWFRGSAPYSFLFFFMYSFIYIFFLSGRQADSGRGSGGCAYVKVYIKIT